MKNCLTLTAPPSRLETIDFKGGEAVDYFVDNLFYKDLREQDIPHVLSLCKYVSLEIPGRMYNQINDAYKYFVELGMIENLHGDKRYYVEALIEYYDNFNKF